MGAALRVVLLCAGLAVGVPLPAPADPPPAEAEVRSVMDAIARAARARDLPQLAAVMAADCRVELRTLIGGREQITLLTRAEYVELLAGGYAALKDLEDYDYQVGAQQVSLENDPPAATVVSQVTETMVFDGRRTLTASEETARLERRGGRLLLVAVSSLTRALP